MKLLFIISITFFVQCTLVIPPIMVTRNKTAIEKQIIGEQTELEKDVWLISSANTVQNKQKDKKKNDEKREEEKESSLVFEGLALLDVFDNKLKKLKSDKVVGENNLGLVSNLMKVKKIDISSRIRKRYNSQLEKDILLGKNYRILIETVKQINRARKMIILGYIQNQKNQNKKLDESKKELLKSQKKQYFESSLKGEYIQLDSGKWKKK